ncbi:BCCT (betaine/carnitine/choline) family transporter [Campylobacter blaseri]|uniref:Choline transporter n=1 Tax=Campylobacter blaseri TaxID=2042961 RepID=A0A2P8QZP1_9BACT|nr:BCCT family transporter [Campylobacter blaseri]PSM51714.1 choline transporter [Campylobacter blaseri]PSM53505.1 choline transporter [Campylobacter blaseri]QKF86311.1 BCCT (betaine/carnitine/choline) family transporter [Campylobacter blaseri]
MKFKKSFNPSVFYPSIVLLFAILAIALIFPKIMLVSLTNIQNYLTETFGWFYVLSVTIIFFSVMFLLFSKYGDIKLGPDHAEAAYSNVSWFAMLFSAGMGIGLMFWGVGEPVMHYLAPPTGDPQTVEAAKQAMTITFFHWGISVWSIYGIVAIILAFFAYRHNLPLTLKSAFYPLVGDKIYGTFGDIIDIFAVIATFFGVTVSLGMGVLQINAGFNHLFEIPMTSSTQIIFIAIITVLVTISATSGLDKGIKLLSNTNMILAVFIILFILLLGNTTGLLNSLVENIGSYMSSFLRDTFNLYAYEKQNESWIGGWTLLYWTWWLSWAPFVGLFIARISRGRTIKEFVAGVLFVPTGFVFLWMTVFGNSAIELINGGYTELATAVNENVSLALFVFLEKFPFSFIMSTIATIMIIIFFVTSADSAAMVIDMLCSNGKDDTPKWQKLWWCVLIGVIASVLLYAGGLKALQAMTIIAAFPLTIALGGCIYGLFKALSIDAEKKRTQILGAISPTGTSKNWREKLQAIIYVPDKRDAEKFLNKIVEPAFKEVKEEFEKNDLVAIIEKNKEKSQIHIHVGMGDDRDFRYGIKILKTEALDYANTDTLYTAEVYLLEGGQGYDVMGWSKDSILNDIVEQYRKHLYFLHKVT